VEFRESDPVANGDGDGAEDAGDAEDAAHAEEPAQEPAEAPAEPGGRRHPSTIGGAFYLVVLAIVAAALVVVAQGDWRSGVKMIGGSLVFAAVVRAVLPAREAGMLAVRRRVVDVVLLVTVGVLLWFLSTSIPNQPPL
jgi:hypothetical protein